jgi:hypothetical protein
MEKKIQNDIMNAMREKDEIKLTALRAVKTSIMQTKTSPTFKGDRDSVLPDSDVLKIIQKLVKEREDSAKIYIDAKRQELADKEISQRIEKKAKKISEKEEKLNKEQKEIEKKRNASLELEKSIKDLLNETN